jgi:hypothetical protein
MRRLLVAAVALAGVTLAPGCQDDEGRTLPTKSQAREGPPATNPPPPGMAPVEEHRGNLPAIPEPERKHTLAVGNDPRNLAPLSAEDLQRKGAAVVGQLKSKGAQELTIRDDAGKEVSLKLDEQTRVLKNGQRASVEALQEGSEVRAAYILQGDQKLVREVEVLQSPAAREKKAD